jgi:hypothetical protein
VKIYIAGPITGDPNYKDKFLTAEQVLAAKGHTVWNPANNPEGFAHHEYMTVCLPAVQFCDAVLMLPGWKKSVGALQEYAHAIQYKKRILFKLSDVDWVDESDHEDQKEECGCRYQI